MDGDKPVGVAGFVRMSRTKMFVFTEAKGDVLANHKITVMKFAKMMLKIADENGWTLVATPDSDIPRAEYFLEHLGFEVDENGEYIRWPV